MANRKYSEEFKKNIVNLYKNGNSVKKISENYNIPKSNIIAWSKKFQEIQINNKENITVKEIIDLKKELQKLIEENSILIDLDDIYEKKDIERKVKFISDNKEDYNIKSLCDMLNISVSTYYNYLANKMLDKSNKEKWINQIVKEVYMENKGIYGVNKMYFALRKKGVHIGKKRVQKIMRELRLYPITLKKHSNVNM
ncbi:Transposase [Sarcina ventriculi]|uniref:IS3 family transposase n=1 Tax=Sarcina ventriculi TaxID=1267 RepID=UPI000D998618|nr:IS3 family transposase [Sarcina ventriculi]SPZ49201.1 Transposase [Sarcina ventriculi]